MIRMVHQRVEEHARLRPEAPAVAAPTASDESLTYGELNRRANRLARHLISLGVGPEVPVGVLARGGAHQVIASLAVLKAGGCYLPLDPAYPDDRSAFALGDAGARVLLSEAALLAEREALRAACPEVFRLDADASVTAGLDETDLPPSATLDNLAYVIYTSGSTGRPKGVEVPHRGLANLVRWTSEAFALTPADRMTRLAGSAFDASVWETWSALSAGACLCVGDDEVVLSPQRLIGWLAAQGVTVSFLPTPVAESVLAEPWPEGLALRLLSTGGDRLHRRPDASHPFVLYNLYGPTECSVIATAGEVGRTGEGLPSIGWPISGIEAHRDEQGELLLGGIGIARGYRGRPDLTAERFPPDPYAAAPGARLYRTGDQVRLLAAGDFDFIGRIDSQVKIRGFRIELGEIEAVLRRHPAVQSAVVQVVSDAHGGKRLVGYVAGHGVSEKELTELLAASLPPYMVPASWMFLPALPLTPNGKVDRRALPLPELDDDGYVEPASEVERELAAVFAEVLGRPRVGAVDDFFALGGHSLSAAQVVSRLRTRLGVELPQRALFDHRTVRRLGEVVAHAGTGRASAARLEARPRPEGESFELPVALAQRGLWLADRASGRPELFNTPFVLALEGPLAPAALAAAAGEVFRRHEALRTTLPARHGEPVAVVARALPAELPVLDLAGLAPEVRAAEAARIAHAESRRQIDLERGPLLRFLLVRHDAGRHDLLCLLHHIVSDDWSISALVRELAAGYEAARGTAPPLPELPVQYADFAAWQRDWLEGEAAQDQLAWWRHTVGAPLPVLDLPADRPRPAAMSYRGARLRRLIPRERLERLGGLAREGEASPFMLLLALYGTLLGRWCGSPRVLVGSPFANRQREEVEGLIGFFVNTLPLPVSLGGDPTLRSLLGQVRETVLGAQAHQDVPFEILVEELLDERDLARSPLADVFLVLGNAPRPPGRLAPEVSLAMSEIDLDVAKVDLTLFLEEREEGLVTLWEYSTDLFDEATVARMAGHLDAATAAAFEGFERPVLELPVLPASERAQIAALAEASGTGHSRGALLHELFFAQAAQTPEAPALIDGETTLTYAELSRRVLRLAGRLRALGVGPEVPVGIFHERSANLLIGLLGTLAAGGFYVPLDPKYPAERLGFMLDDSGCAVILTQRALASRLEGRRVLRLDEPAENEEAPAVELPRGDAGNLAYLIYTSGSTGRPKAVAIEHRSAVTFAHWARGAFSAEELSGVLASTSITFDLSVFELFVPLAWGGTVILAENALELPGLPARERVRLVNTVPSAIAELLRTGGLPRSVTTVNLAGEALPRALADRVYAEPCVKRLYNLYGPSEDTTYSTFTLVERATARQPTIGGPVDATSAHVVDARLAWQPLGVPGELLLGGEGLARGYYGRPELTAERFVPDPFAAVPGARLYRTGDLARRREDGVLEYLGRMDRQVKVRGFRIELGEIESALAAQPGIEAAAVLVRDDEALGRHLVGCLAAATEPSIPALRAALAERLPDYMVPTAWAVLPAFPLSPNGKVDRGALAKLLPGLAAPPAHAASEGGRPLSPVEELLAGLFADVLGRERVGRDEDFFHLGGQSLLAARLLARVRDAFGVELRPRTMFERPTVARLAEAVEAARHEAGQAESAPALVRRRPGPTAPVSYAQQRLWLVERLLPSAMGLYSMPFAVTVSGPLSVPALRAALAEIVRRHEVLRTVIVQVEGEPVQLVRPYKPPALPVVDLSGLARGPAALEAARLSAAEAARPFDLAAGPLVRAVLVRLSGEEVIHGLLLNLHHVVADGWSIERLFGELGVLLEAVAAGSPSPLPEPALQYADYAVWQRAYLASGALEGQLAYWRRQLSGLTPVELPADRPRPAEQSFAGAVEWLPLPEETVSGLERYSRGAGAALFMTLAAAFSALLARYTESLDVGLGTSIASRGRQELEPLIGHFVNTLVLRTDLGGDPAFGEIVARVRRTALAAYDHQDVPFDRLVEELAPPRDLSRSPLVQVVLGFQELVPHRISLASGLELEVEECTTQTAKYDLALHVERSGEDVELAAEYATDLFDRATVARLLGHFASLLAAAAGRPETRLSELALFGAAERGQLLSAGLGPAVADDPGGSLEGLVAEQARRTPDAVAVLDEARSLTYAELELAAGRLARALADEGVGPDTLVGIALDRSVDLMVALLAVVKAGGAYVPLDPGYPAERLAWMREDAGLSLVLTEEWLAARAEAGGGGDVPALPGGERLAWMIYTSGSTGRPKGAMVTQRAAVNHMRWMQREYPLGPDDRVLQKTPISFDASVWEFWAPLVAGATVVVARPGGHRDPAYLAEAVERFEVTVLQLVPTLLRALLDDGRLAGCRSLRRVFCGGEALGADLLERYYASPLGPHVELVNLYGPTETAIEVTSWRCRSEAAGEAALLGRPIDGARLRVLDWSGALAPWGVPGELVVGGVPVGRGYWRRPAETAERFVPDPTGEPGARCYRTGDQARWVGEGELAYLGRRDGQIKLHGVRLEPGEVEAALREHPAVAEAAVVVRDDESLGRRLVAYLAVPGEAPPAAELAAFLAGRLPEAMIPSAWVTLPELPLLPSGKLDRWALLAIAPERGSEPDEAAPATPLEELVAGLFAGLLGVERVGREADFFQLGGHSILAVQLVARLRQAAGVELALRTVFERRTVARLAEAVAAARAEPGPRDASLYGARAAGPAPLSLAQQRLWVIEHLVPPGLGLYNLPLALTLSGSLSVPVLAAALGEIVRRHQVLRTVIVQIEGSPAQRVQPFTPPALPVVDLSGLAANTAALEASRLAAAEAVRAFDLAAGPLLRALLVRLGGQEETHGLLLNMHHIVADGWSVDRLLGELASLLEAYGEGRPSPLPELPIQYADYAQWQRGYLAEGVLETQLAFWRGQLAGLEPVELPADRPRPPVQSFAGGAEWLALPEVTLGGLERLSREAGATLFMTLAAAFSALVARYAGRRDVALGTPVAGRGRREIEPLIGFFVNTLVLRTDLGGDPGFGEVVARMRESALSAYDHQEVPFDRLVEELAPARDLSRSPLVQVVFALQDLVPRRLVLGSGLELQVEECPTQTAKYDLSLHVERTAGAAELAVEFATDLFDRATVARLLGHFANLLAGVVASPALRLSELPLLADAERRQVVEEWNRTATASPRDKAVHEVFAARAAETPEALAVLCGEERLSYAELAARSDALARRLAARGVRPGDRVAVVLERSVEQVTATLAVLKAGAAYVPLDPRDPAERLRFVLEDSGARWAVTAGPSPALEGLAVEALTVADAGADDRGAEAALPARVPAEAPAYVIYTSGSTGRPKGVVVPHRAVCRLVLDNGYLEVTREDRLVHLSNPAFDAAVFEIWGALAAGAAVVVVPREVAASPVRLTALLAQSGATVAFVTTALFNLLVREVPGAFARLRAVLFGGEAVDAEAVRYALETSPPQRLLHAYGPTEATTFTTTFEVRRLAAGAATVPIGGPIGNTTVHVVGRDLEPVPVGVPGELLVGGVGLAYGYLDRPELTAERFIPDPFAAEPGERLYRTGDLVRRGADGAIEFVGRIDSQVKLRGFRIELGEIEAALLARPEVEQVVVMLRDDGGDRRLVAYVVPAGSAVTPEGLREALGRRLPEPMVPSAFVLLDALPLNANGKIDRRALPAPEVGVSRDYVAPRTPLEAMTAELWREVLGVERVGAFDKFWDLGGHSLLATKLLARLHDALGLELPLSVLFDRPALGAFAEAVGAAILEASDEEALEELGALAEDAA